MMGVDGGNGVTKNKRGLKGVVIWEDGIPGIMDRLCMVQIKQTNVVCLGNGS